MNKIECNCPDAIHKRKKIPGATTYSKLFDSDWSAGFEGAKNCIHELAVMRIRGEFEKCYPNGLPNDLPTPPLDIIKPRVFQFKEINSVKRIK